MLGSVAMRTAVKKYGRQLASYTARTDAGRATLRNVSTAAVYPYIETKQSVSARDTSRIVTRMWQDFERVKKVQTAVKLGVLAGAEIGAARLLGLSAPDTVLGIGTTLAGVGAGNTLAYFMMPNWLTDARDAYVAEATFQTWLRDPQCPDEIYFRYLNRYDKTQLGLSDYEDVPKEESYFSTVIEPRCQSEICTGSLDEATLHAKFAAKHRLDLLYKLFNSMCEKPKAGERELSDLEERKKIVANAILQGVVMRTSNYDSRFGILLPNQYQNIINYLSPKDADRFTMILAVNDFCFRTKTVQATQTKALEVVGSITAMGPEVVNEAIGIVKNTANRTFFGENVDHQSRLPLPRAAVLLAAFGPRGRAELLSLRSQTENIREYVKRRGLTSAYLDSLLMIPKVQGEPGIATVLGAGDYLLYGPEQIRLALDEKFELGNSVLICGASVTERLRLTAQDDVAIAGLIKIASGNNLRWVMSALTPFVARADVRACFEGIMTDGKQAMEFRVAAAEALCANNDKASSESFGKIADEAIDCYSKLINTEVGGKYLKGIASLVELALGYAQAQPEIPEWAKHYIQFRYLNLLALGTPDSMYRYLIVSRIELLRPIVERLPLYFNFRSTYAECHIQYLLVQYAHFKDASENQRIMRDEVFPVVFDFLFNAERSSMTLAARLSGLRNLVRQAKHYLKKNDPLYVSIESAVRGMPELGGRQRDIDAILNG